MPNHITNCLTIKEDTNDIPLKELLKTLIIKNDKDEDVFDFNAIIPQPENMFHGNLGNAERKMCAEEGRPNWYDWNRENWGTKWGAYDLTIVDDEQEDEISVQFLTAWSPPQPIFDKLIEMGFDISGLWKDEGDTEGHPINYDQGSWYVNISMEFCP